MKSSIATRPLLVALALSGLTGCAFLDPSSVGCKADKDCTNGGTCDASTGICNPPAATSSSSSGSATSSGHSSSSTTATGSGTTTTSGASTSGSATSSGSSTSPESSSSSSSVSSGSSSASSSATTSTGTTSSAASTSSGTATTSTSSSTTVASSTGSTSTTVASSSGTTTTTVASSSGTTTTTIASSSGTTTTTVASSSGSTSSTTGSSSTSSSGSTTTDAGPCTPPSVWADGGAVPIFDALALIQACEQSRCYSGPSDLWFQALSLPISPAQAIATESGGFTINPIEVSPCLNALAAQSCDDFALGTIPTACLTATTGSVAGGKPCLASIDCAGSESGQSFCDTSLGTCPGFCNQVAPAGTNCSSDEGCTRGNACIGGFCNPISLPSQLPGAGKSCTTACQPGYACLQPFLPNCIPIRREGESCQGAPTDFCENFTFCQDLLGDGGTCVRDSSIGGCGPQSVGPGPGVTLKGCLPGTWCGSPDGGSATSCLPLLADGASCNPNLLQCASGTCDIQTCNGSTCTFACRPVCAGTEVDAGFFTFPDAGHYYPDMPGSVQWVTQLGPADGGVDLRAIVIDPTTGNLLVGGAQIVGGVQVPAVWQLNSSGVPTGWAAGLVSPGAVNALVLDGNGNVAWAGSVANAFGDGGPAVAFAASSNLADAGLLWSQVYSLNPSQIAAMTCDTNFGGEVLIAVGDDLQPASAAQAAWWQIDATSGNQTSRIGFTGPDLGFPAGGYNNAFLNGVTPFSKWVVWTGDARNRDAGGGAEFDMVFGGLNPQSGEPDLFAQDYQGRKDELLGVATDPLNPNGPLVCPVCSTSADCENGVSCDTTFGRCSSCELVWSVGNVQVPGVAPTWMLASWDPFRSTLTYDVPVFVGDPGLADYAQSIAFGGDGTMYAFGEVDQGTLPDGGGFLGLARLERNASVDWLDTFLIGNMYQFASQNLVVQSPPGGPPTAVFAVAGSQVIKYAP